VMAEAIIYSAGLKTCLGVLQGHRFDLEIRDVPGLRVRAKLESAGWAPSPCYVVDADTKYCQYTVWLDPAHDYQVAKAVVQNRPDHLRPNGQPYEPGERGVTQLEKIRFEQRDGHWLPVESTSRSESTYLNPRTHRLQSAQSDWHFKLTRFVLNPDHAAQRSFAADDIRDGAKARVVGEDRRFSTSRTGNWQNGRVLDTSGKVLWTPDSLSGTATNQPPQSALQVKPRG
jgi:hypothetical protein